MAAPTNIFVDPSINADTGAGTLGDPYGDLQYALDTMTRDAANGDQINIKAGTAEVLSAVLSFASYGVPAAAAPLILRGYTSAANDGGVGEVNCDGSNFIDGRFFRTTHLINLHIYAGAASGEIIQLGIDCTVQNCEVNNAQGGGIYFHSSANRAIGNNIYDVGGMGIHYNNSRGIIVNNFLKNGPTYNMVNAIVINSANNVIARNVISITGDTNGIADNAFDDGSSITNNSILSSSGTGKGITIDSSSTEALVIINNVVEGFSGTGGVGILASSTGEFSHRISNNAVFNCTTNYTLGDNNVLTSDNEVLGSTPFAKSGADTFANRFVYFAPNDVGNVLTGALA